MVQRSSQLHNVRRIVLIAQGNNTRTTKVFYKIISVHTTNYNNFNYFSTQHTLYIIVKSATKMFPQTTKITSVFQIVYNIFILVY